jgi:hypothetical protein
MAQRQKLDLKTLLPLTNRNEMLDSMISNLFNRFVSEEQTILINGRIGQSVAGEPDISADSLDREINALIPALYTKSGSKESVFTFFDLLNRLDVLDTDTDHLRDWIAEQSFNYTLPIDIDKFINYSQYYWYGTNLAAVSSSPPDLSWNPKIDPEYYVIQAPQATDKTKLDVRLATTRNINLWANDRPPETFTVRFLSSNTFRVTSDLVSNIYVNGASNNEYTLTDTTPGVVDTITLSTDDGNVAPAISAGTGKYDLLSFYLTSGNYNFSAGDYFTVQITYFTSSILISFNTANAVGKGAISGVQTMSGNIFVDGVRVINGDRILVKDQTDPTENGIYLVYPNIQWERAPDAVNAINFPAGSEVHVTSGGQGGRTFISSGTLGTDLAFLTSNVQPSTINDWQKYNFWIHRDDFVQVESLGVTLDKAIKATRPIIEYKSSLEINNHSENGIPTSPPTSGTPNSVQTKTRFNQIPQFNLYRYDGTHQGSTSGIYFYVEDSQYPVDTILQKRVKTTANTDYVFGIGLQDSAGRLLYYKESTFASSTFKSIWQGGPSVPEATDPIFVGLTVDPGSVTINNISSNADNQTWTLMAFDSSTWNVFGSRSGKLAIDAHVGVEYTHADDLKFTINAGVNTPLPGESFMFTVHAPIAPRYVKKNVDGKYINYPGWKIGDATDGVIDGAWMNPARMFENIERQLEPEIIFADYLGHARSVIKNQNGFIGSSIGNNNFRMIPFDNGVGGTIREFSSNFPLLASMLIQKDISPLTIIDFAENAYHVALSSIQQFILNDLPTYLASAGTISTTILDPNAPDIQQLLAYFESLRASNENLKSVFSDSTALVANWPATLPMLGLCAPVIPRMAFDLELNINVIIHHDGHVSPYNVRDLEFDQNLIRTKVTRADGQITTGIFAQAMPTNPYARQLWYKTSTTEMFIFDVLYDTVKVPPAGVIGNLWFNRITGMMKEWSDIQHAWVNSLVLPADCWKPFSSEAIKNSLVLAVEQKLFDSVHPSQQISIDISETTNTSPKFAEYNAIELARYAAAYQFDTYASDYKSDDPFTWNYSSVLSQARWWDIYESNFRIPGLSLPTCRPDLEPWKLMGHDTKPAWWMATYASTIVPTANLITARAIALTDVTPLFGLQTVDGVALANNDVVLLTNQTITTMNGVYVASSGGWGRVPSASVPMVHGLTVHVTEGASRSNTMWVLTTSDPIDVLSTVLTFEQSRTWSQQMWTDIAAHIPGVKLCVNIFTDELFAPYVSPQMNPLVTVNAMTTTIPSSKADTYLFGQNGPIETVWKKSVEYKYGLARSMFRLKPLPFLDKTWGETYIQKDKNVRVERNTMAPLSASKFLMHGEKLNIINEYTPAECAARFAGLYEWTAPATLKFQVTHTADNLTVVYFYVNDIHHGIINVGQTFDLPTTDGVTLTQVSIKDLGIPFELGDTFTLTLNADLTTMTWKHVPARVKIFKGLGQWFTHLLRHNFIDAEFSDATIAYRGWEVKLAHRLGALIRPDSLSILTPMGDLPPTAYNVLLKKTSDVDSIWISGLRVQLLEMRSKVQNQNGLYIPKSDASDWIFRVESYNPEHPILECYELKSIADGGNFETFSILDKSSTALSWNRLTDKTAIVSKTTPVTIKGLQNVIDFIYGYVTRLEDLGWTTQSDTPITDALTGRNIDWQLEVEKLVNNIYLGMSAGDAFILNPFASKLTINTPYGLLSKYTESNFVDANSMQAVFDVTGKNIPLSSVNVIRTDEKTVTYSNTPMFSAHVFLDEYEHLILMNKKFSDEIASNTVFNTFLGIRINTAFLNFFRQRVIDRKPTIDGFFLSGNDVKRNMSSSVDAIANYYDADKTFYEKTTATHALALLGFTKKDYFSNINVTDTTQFNFWRGLIQVKGTNMAIDAFVNYKKFDRASTDEYWAYKLAEFGDARERSFPEIKLTINDVTQKFTQVQFYSDLDPNYNALDLYTQIEKMNDARWFSIDDLGTSMHFEATPITETLVTTASGYFKLKNIYHNGDSMEPTITSSSGVVNCYFVNASLVYVDGSDTFTIHGYTWMNPTKHSPLKLFNYATNTLVEEIGLWHPAIGIHAAMPLEVVDMISSVDPTSYNYSTQTTNNPNYRKLKPWGKREVGRVWWDTSNLAYIPYYDATIFPSRAARHARWGSLAEWASVDLYEWVESPVEPAKYNERAALEEGDSNIDSSVRLSGTVALQKFYSRDRSITASPIAWSYVPTGAQVHPSFGSETFVDVWVSGNRLIVDSGRTADANLVEGRNFGAFKASTNKPNGEFKIGAKIEYVVGSEADIRAPVIGTQCSLSVIAGGLFGTRIGTIYLETYVDGVDYVRMKDSTGFAQDIEIVAANDVDTQVLFKFDKFGLLLTVAVNPNDSSATIAGLITASDIVIRETVDFTTTVDWTEYPGPKLSNYVATTNTLNDVSEYIWITWAIPTQAQLDADLLYPFNSWRPYPGDVKQIYPSADVVKAMKDTASTLTLKTGIDIKRYNSTWGNWTALEASKVEQISNGTDLITFVSADTIDSNRLSIYANGVQINPGAYAIIGNVVNLVNTLPEGTSVRLLYRAYQPSAAELAFDPEVKEDFSVQTQFKQDYQYTKLDIRDTDGNMTGSKYYFWVQHKTVPQANKSMSLVQASNILKSGASIYALFSRMNPLYVLKNNTSTEKVIDSSFIYGDMVSEQTTLTESGKSVVMTETAAFDSFAIAGLSSIVSRNDAYKLRMLRDFTLRDDPEEMNLKNVHVEWALIRKTQSSKIPRQLWDKLTDAISGADSVGNQLPSQARIDYDLKNGTRSRFGFNTGQIYADTALLRTSVVHTILNTSLVIRLGHTTIPDTITALDMSQSDTWFTDTATARTTMNLIWNTARASQINEIFFNSLDDALANNYEFSDLFKTSLITVNSSVSVTEAAQTELIDEQY